MIYQGVVISAFHYVDISYSHKTPSVQLTVKATATRLFGLLRTERLLNGLLHGYRGEQLKAGDIINFEFKEPFHGRVEFLAIEKVK